MNETLMDHHARMRAATADDRNVVVTAGAGTGKTTLLVNRLVHLLLRETNPLPLPSIVALTFTNKAASELKVRLRERLQALLHGATIGEGSAWLGGTDERVRDAIARALSAMETASIGTIHHFAARLLRLYPVECGVDPTFEEDSGSVFQALFDREWANWLEHELGTEGAHHEQWRTIFEHLSLREIKQFIYALSSEIVPLHEYSRTMRKNSVPPGLEAWLRHQAEEAQRLLAAKTRQRKLERMVEAARQVFGWAAQGTGWDHRPPEWDAWATHLSGTIPSKTQGWSEEEHHRATRLVRTAQAIVHLRPAVLEQVVELAQPFLEHCRQCFVHEGYVSFDGLIVRARNLLRDHPNVRRELKAQFRALLVDEFQDTDPVQYEMILYLAETLDHEADRWENVELEPGKLFIVGDPKQSIYAFRRADMEAYDQVVHHRILGPKGSGERHTLRVNFRSHGALLNVVNTVFARLFPAHGIEGVQPPFELLEPADITAPPLPDEGVELRLVRAEHDDDSSTEALTRLEAEALARWLREEILDRAVLRVGGEPVRAKPRHIAILFRKLSSVQPYVEALRRYAIPFLVEGERHFYERQEIVDVINLLRAVANPSDTVALVGVLRSPLGGLHDREIASLARHGALNYRSPDPGKFPGDEEFARAAARVAPIYRLLGELNDCLPRVPVPDLFDILLTKVPILEIAAASSDGERAVGNIQKLGTMVQEFLLTHGHSLYGLVEELHRRIADPPPEGEATQTDVLPDDDGDGAIQIASMHKAKGLEFPMVILAGLHQQVNRRDPLMVHHDWSTNILGCRFRQWRTLGGVYVGQKLEEREQAEQLRVLYVAMTRARRRLTLFSAVPRTRYQNTFLSFIVRGLGVELDELLHQRAVSVGAEQVPVSVVTLEDEGWRSVHTGSSEQPMTSVALDVDRFAEAWHVRARRWDAAKERRVIDSPTRYAQRIAATSGSWSERGQPSAARSQPRFDPTGRDSERARLIGIMAHRLLAEWDFQAEPSTVQTRIERMCARDVPDALRTNLSELVEELTEIFRSFLASESYALLQRATILGREVPFIMPGQAEGAPKGGDDLPGVLNRPLDGSGTNPERPITSSGPLVAEGVIDVLYRIDGVVWIGDYKTDHVEDEELMDRANRYRPQLSMYRRAVCRGLGIDRVGARVFFLRTGHSLEL